MSYDDDRMMADTAAIAARAKPAAPSPALTREALAAALQTVDPDDDGNLPYHLDEAGVTAYWLRQADAILDALSKTPPPTSTREEL